MKSLTQMNTIKPGIDPEIPPKLKPFKAVAEKLSSTGWRGILSIAAMASVLSFAPDVLALQLGDSGPGVANLQAALGVTADGLYGPQTASAVANYQRACGLLVDGIAGSQTLSVLSSGTCPPGGVSILPIQPPTTLPIRPPSGGGYLPITPSDNGPYVVAIPGNNVEILASVRQAVPSAIVDNTDAGPFINAGAFEDYSEASRVSDRLQGLGFNSRVVYRD